MPTPVRVAMLEPEIVEDALGLLQIGVEALVDIAAIDRSFHDPLAVRLAPANANHAALRQVSSSSSHFVLASSRRRPRAPDFASVGSNALCQRANILGDGPTRCRLNSPSPLRYLTSTM